MNWLPLAEGRSLRIARILWGGCRRLALLTGLLLLPLWPAHTALGHSTRTKANLAAQRTHFTHTALSRFYHRLGYTLRSGDNPALMQYLTDWLYKVPYRWGGDSHKGIDCSAFVRRVHKEVFAKRLPRTAAAQFDFCKEKRIRRADLRPGDLVFFKRGRKVFHVGIYLHDGIFVNAAKSKGVSFASLDNGYWSRYFHGGGRLPAHDWKPVKGKNAKAKVQKPPKKKRKKGKKAGVTRRRHRPSAGCGCHG